MNQDTRFEFKVNPGNKFWLASVNFQAMWCNYCIIVVIQVKLSVVQDKINLLCLYTAK